MKFGSEFPNTLFDHHISLHIPFPRQLSTGELQEKETLTCVARVGVVHKLARIPLVVPFYVHTERGTHNSLRTEHEHVSCLQPRVRDTPLYLDIYGHAWKTT